MSNSLIQDVTSLRRYIDLMQRQSTQWRNMLVQLSGDTARLKAKWQDQDFYNFDRQVQGLSANLEARIKDVKKQAVMLSEMTDRLQTFKDIR